MFGLEQNFGVVNSPEYISGYTDGFNDAKRMYEKRLIELLKETRDIKPFCDMTSTSTTDFTSLNKTI